VYQGNLFVHDRPLAESGMEKHPINPMTDSDIRRWLRLQTKGSVGQFRSQLSEVARRKIRQALRDPRLADIRLVSWTPCLKLTSWRLVKRFLTRRSSRARPNSAWTSAQFHSHEIADASQFVFGGVIGPAVALAGSCSSATREQVNLHKRKHPTLQSAPAR